MVSAENISTIFVYINAVFLISVRLVLNQPHLPCFPYRSWPGLQEELYRDDEFDRIARHV